MNARTNNRGLFQRRSLWLALICLAVIAGISYATIGGRLQDDPVQDQPTYEVQQGPLTVSIAVSGTIQAREKVVIKNELEGSSTILFLVPEGSRVKKGDLLVELDASALVDQRVDQQIKVQNAEAAYINARENMAIIENQAKSDIDQAQLTYDFAKQDLKKYNEGEFPKLQKEAETQITLKKEELNLAEEKVKWSQILFDEKYLSQSELQNDELAANRTQLQLDLAKSDLDLLNTYTYQRQIAQLESDVSQAQMALERTQRQANANIVQASAELQAKLSEFEQQQSKLTKLDEQISKAKIYAPMDGLAVYATSVQMSFRGNNEPLEEGQTVRERQELIHLPTTSSYIVEAKVPESSLEKIHTGLPVRITVDALPGKTYTGKVSTIAPLPNAQSIFMNPDLKVYDTQILIDGAGEDLRSGMGCQAEIIVDYFNEAVYIPVQAIIRIGNQPTVYVANGREFEPRSIELGPDNNRLAQIKSGLKKGEIVLLTPPLSKAEVTAKEGFGEDTDIKKIVDEAKENNAKNAQTQPPASAPGADAPGGGRQRGGGQGAPDGASGGGFGGRNGGQGGPGGGGFGNRGGGQGGPESGFGGGQGGPGGGGFGGRGGGRPNMTPEQQEEMRKRFESMTPEERDAMRQRFQRNRDGGGAGGPGGGQGGGAPQTPLENPGN